MEKKIYTAREWDQVIAELDAEQLKVASYDQTILSKLGDIRGTDALDYGSGPGVLALALKKLGAKSSTFDINAEMNRQCAEKLGRRSVIDNIRSVRDESFDLITCNLVLCINPAEEVGYITSQIRRLLRPQGRIFIGFCNPGIFDVPESRLDYRYPTGNAYEQPHRYEKVKKEGDYRITEDHRPIEWYEQVYERAGLKPVATHYTPAYAAGGRTVEDFVIFEQTV